MQKADLNNPGERKKLIAAAILGVIAIIFLWWAFIGFGGSSTNPTPRRETAGAGLVPNSRVAPIDSSRAQTPPEVKGNLLTQLQPVSYQSGAVAVPEPKRNIFAYYEAPAKSGPGATTVAPTPTPTPPVLVAAVEPATVYARTGDFTLQVSGDKFSPILRIFVDDRELPTRYLSAQQLSAIVPAALIAIPGQRQVIVRTPDGRLYSNVSGLAVSPPPTPNYNYVGILGTHRYIDIALVQDRNSKEILNVQRGDVLSGRFRVTSISEKELVLIDTSLKIKHTLPMSNDGEKGLGPLARPTPKADAEDDEP